MILGYESLRPLMRTLVGHEDLELLNPASIDIRVGGTFMYEQPLLSDELTKASEHWDEYCNLDDLPIPKVRWRAGDLTAGKCILAPNEFVLCSTFENITVPDDCAVELRLKSSSARAGFDHALAFWVDPGWSGVLTMEVKNITRFHYLPLIYQERFAQIIVHRLEQKTAHPYHGKYQGAVAVEAVKS